MIKKVLTDKGWLITEEKTEDWLITEEKTGSISPEIPLKNKEVKKDVRISGEGERSNRSRRSKDK